MAKNIKNTKQISGQLEPQVMPIFTETVISNGMGAPSMYLLVLAAEKKIDCNISITADTGSENDRLLNTGERITAKKYFDNVIMPYAKDNKINAFFVRAVDKNKKPLPSLIELLEKGVTAGVPFHGTRAGKLPQGCTGKYKINATRQQLRRLGYKKAKIALGLTYSELHRMKDSDVKWCKNVFPLIEIGWTDRNMRNREAMYKELDKRGIPYLMSSECDMCPHKNWIRWERTSPEMIDRIAKIEQKFDGLYFTDKLLPLKQALEIMKREYEVKGNQGNLFEIDESVCETGYCML